MAAFVAKMLGALGARTHAAQAFATLLAANMAQGRAAASMQEAMAVLAAKTVGAPRAFAKCAWALAPPAWAFDVVDVVLGMAPAAVAFLPLGPALACGANGVRSLEKTRCRAQ